MDRSHNKDVGQNLEAERRAVFYAHLDPPDIELPNPFARKCPVCKEGTLLGQRGEGFEVLQEDYCVLCGQKVLYLDIERVNGEQAHDRSLL
jgi:hypothetical protein